MSASKVYDKLLEKATSSLLLETDWESILSMCDLIRQGDVQAKYAVAALKKKLTQENINTILFSLQCLESMVKNCGSKIHQEIATRDTMEQLRGIALIKTDPIKSKILELIQCWAHAFKRNPNYKIVEDYFNSMKLEGFQYPTLKESEAMFDVEEAPAWKEDAEATCCFRCRSEFTTLKRRHHCRACGQIFCNACSSKTAAIPKFGIEKEVRVCDLCYDKLNGNMSVQAAGSSSSSSGASVDGGLPAEYVNSALFKESIAESVKKPAVKSEQEFEDELQLALAISQSEAEAQESMKRNKSGGSKSGSLSSQSQNTQPKSSGEPKKSSIKSSKTRSDTNESSKFASAPYLENSKGQSSQLTENGQILLASQSDEEMKINAEIDAFVDSTKSTLEIFINRMKSDQQRGRSITNDTAVQSLFLQLQHMHPKLMSYIKYQEDARGYYENLQDKLTQLKDAREALNALRHENYEKKRQDMEERERQRQIQIAQKLQYMRQQKQNYYQYQNQLNLQHLQEKERELQMRMEQQRQLVMQRDQQFLGQSSGMQYLPMPNEYGQIPNQLPFHTGMPPNYQHYMENNNNNFQQYPSVSPSKLISSMGNMSLQQQQQQNPAVNNSMYNTDPNMSQFHAQQNQYQGINQFSNQQYQNQIQQPQNGHGVNGQSQNGTVNGQLTTLNGQNGHMTPANGQLPIVNAQNGNMQFANGNLPHANEQIFANSQAPQFTNNQSYYQQPTNEHNQPGLSVNDAQLISFD